MPHLPATEEVCRPDGAPAGVRRVPRYSSEWPWRSVAEGAAGDCAPAEGDFQQRLAKPTQPRLTEPFGQQRDGTPGCRRDIRSRSASPGDAHLPRWEPHRAPAQAAEAWARYVRAIPRLKLLYAYDSKRLDLALPKSSRRHVERVLSIWFCASAPEPSPVLLVSRHTWRMSVHVEFDDDGGVLALHALWCILVICMLRSPVEDSQGEGGLVFSLGYSGLFFLA